MANEITMETMQLRLKEIINKEAYPDKDGGIEMYLDYRDTLEESTLHEIMKADNPREHFEELLSDWTLDGSLYYEDELEKTIKKTEPAFTEYAKKLEGKAKQIDVYLGH